MARKGSGNRRRSSRSRSRSRTRRRRKRRRRSSSTTEKEGHALALFLARRPRSQANSPVHEARQLVLPMLLPQQHVSPIVAPTPPTPALPSRRDISQTKVTDRGRHHPLAAPPPRSHLPPPHLDDRLSALRRSACSRCSSRSRRSHHYHHHQLRRRARKASRVQRQRNLLHVLRRRVGTELISRRAPTALRSQQIRPCPRCRFLWKEADAEPAAAAVAALAAARRTL